MTPPIATTSQRCFFTSLNSPSISHSAPRFCAKPPRPSRTSAHDANHFYPCFGRRGFVLISTLPFLFPSQEFTQVHDAQASESVEPLVIKEELRKVLSKTSAAGVLRLVFHDAGTFEMDDKSGGMNGSIVYELDRPENAGLKKSLKNDQHLQPNSSMGVLLFRFYRKQRLKWIKYNQFSTISFMGRHDCRGWSGSSYTMWRSNNSRLHRQNRFNDVRSRRQTSSRVSECL